MEKMIYLDMDGTIANFYGVEGWLDDLLNENSRPYEVAEPLYDESTLLKMVALGYTLGIVSWLSKNSTKEFDTRVRKAKREWLKEHYPHIEFNEIHIVKYGTPKYKVVKNINSILIDDEEPNRNAWKGIAYEPNFLESF